MKTIITVILSLFSCAFAFSQNKSEISPTQFENILKITYRVMVGGERGGYATLEITKYSIIYFNKHWDAEYKFVDEQRHWANTPTNWNMLCNALNIDNFNKVKSGPSMQPIDGADVFYSIETHKTKYSLLNGDRDVDHYKLIASFCDRVERLIPKL